MSKKIEKTVLAKISKRLKRWERNVKTYLAETNPIVNELKSLINEENLKPEERQILAARYGNTESNYYTSNIL